MTGEPPFEVPSLQAILIVVASVYAKSLYRLIGASGTS